ncbi:MAG: DUF4347 domain-containing protein [Burkholderiaceae bacterium]
MNKSYKSIWNETLGTYVAAAETASAGGRKSSTSRKARRQPERAYSGQLALEPRIVFDAALPATLVEAQADHADAQDAGVTTDLDQLDTQPAPAPAPAPVLEPVPVTAATNPATADESDAAGGSNDVEAASSGDAAAPEGGVSDASLDPAQDAPIESVEAPTAPDDAGSDGDQSVAAMDNGSVDALEGSQPSSEQGSDPVVEVADVHAANEPAEPMEPEVERVEVVFVDAQVEDAADGLQWHPGEVYVLDASRDGVEQMAEILNGRTGIDAIHIISHGSAGELNLGSGTLNSGSLSGEYADEMAVIAAALSPDADLMLYGCDVAATEAGVTFIDALAQATGADVAASNNDTGAESLGGDWVLEARNTDGVIETVAISAQAYAGLLTTTVSNGAGALLAVQARNIYSIDITTGKATLLTVAPATVGGVSTGTDLGPVHTIFPKCVADQKGHAQGAKRGRGSPPARFCNAAHDLFGCNPKGKGRKQRHSSLRS